jgi:hypothetical protein
MRKAVLVRMQDDLLAKVDAEADRVHRSRNNFINHVLRQWCDPDAVTIEDARDIVIGPGSGPDDYTDGPMDPNARLVDPGVAYETEATDESH